MVIPTAGRAVLKWTQSAYLLLGCQLIQALGEELIHMYQWLEVILVFRSFFLFLSFPIPPTLPFSFFPSSSLTPSLRSISKNSLLSWSLQSIFSSYLFGCTGSYLHAGSLVPAWELLIVACGI